MQIKLKIRKKNFRKNTNTKQSLLKFREELINEHIITEQKKNIQVQT